MNKLPMLSDAGIKRFHQGIKGDFPSVSLADVRSAARKCHEGADTGEDVVEALLRADVEECMELIAANPNSNELKIRVTELFEQEAI